MFHCIDFAIEFIFASAYRGKIESLLNYTRTVDKWRKLILIILLVILMLYFNRILCKCNKIWIATYSYQEIYIYDMYFNVWRWKGRDVYFSNNILRHTFLIVQTRAANCLLTALSFEKARVDTLH